MERVNWERVRDILISIICVGILFWAAWAIVGQFVHALVILLLSMAVAFLLTPVVDFLDRYMLRVIACLIVYAIALAVVGGLLSAVIFSLIKQVQTFSQTVINYFTILPTQVVEFQNWLVKQGIPQSNIDAAVAQLRTQAINFAQSLATNVPGILFSIADAFVNIVLVVVLSFYLTLDGKRIRNSLIGIAPKRSLSHVRLFEDALNRVVGNYIRGQLILAAIIGVMAWLGTAILGLSQFSLIIGALAFLFETIPMVGPALASIPAILISLLLPDPFPRTFYILAYFVIVQIIESNVLGPRIVGHAVGLHPVASIFALIIFVQLFGALGALLATPIVAAAWVVITSIYRSARGETAEEIIGKKRSPWIRRRPITRHLRHRAITPVESTQSQDDTSAPPAKGPFVTRKIEHIDLLRPVPDIPEESAYGEGPPDTRGHSLNSFGGEGEE
jgi:predicted PurR-regulated permease PerM